MFVHAQPTNKQSEKLFFFSSRNDKNFALQFASANERLSFYSGMIHSHATGLRYHITLWLLSARWAFFTQAGPESNQVKLNPTASRNWKHSAARGHRLNLSSRKTTEFHQFHTGTNYSPTSGITWNSYTFSFLVCLANCASRKILLRLPKHLGNYLTQLSTKETGKLQSIRNDSSFMDDTNSRKRHFRKLTPGLSGSLTSRGCEMLGLPKYQSSLWSYCCSNRCKAKAFTYVSSSTWQNHLQRDQFEWFSNRNAINNENQNTQKTLPFHYGMNCCAQTNRRFWVCLCSTKYTQRLPSLAFHVMIVFRGHFTAQSRSEMYVKFSQNSPQVLRSLVNEQSIQNKKVYLWCVEEQLVLTKWPPARINGSSKKKVFSKKEISIFSFRTVSTEEIRLKLPVLFWNSGSSSSVKKYVWKFET